MTGGAATPALPRLLVLTDRRACTRPLPEVVRAAVGGGATAVVLRERDLPAAERARLADALLAALAPVGGLLVLASGPPAGWSGPVAAVHLAARDPRPDPRPPLAGRSCHDPGEVRRAAAEGCDWVTVSPVFATTSKPGHGPALGPAGLRALVGAAGAVASYALGGVGPATVAACRQAGAYGVAVLGAVMRAQRPERVVTDLLAALADTRDTPDAPGAPGAPQPAPPEEEP